MKHVSENILKLRELNHKLTTESYKSEECAKIVDEIKEIIELSKLEIDESESTSSKVKCYESMCSKIILILNQIKII